MRNEGGGFAAGINRAMPEGGIQVTSHQSPVTRGPHPWPWFRPEAFLSCAIMKLSANK